MINKRADNYINSSKVNDSTDNSFLFEESVECSCNKELRTIFDTLLLGKKVKQQELADYLGVDKGFVSRICNGKENPPLRIKLKIAEYFGVDSALIWRNKNE